MYEKKNDYNINKEKILKNMTERHYHRIMEVT